MVIGYSIHRALKSNSHIRFCNRLLTKQGIILGHGEAKNGCLNLCHNRSAHLFCLFLSTLEDIMSKVGTIILILNGHGIVVIIHGSDAGGPRFESWHFYFYIFCLCLGSSIAAEVQTTFFGLTMDYINGLYGQKLIAKTSM